MLPTTLPPTMPTDDLEDFVTRGGVLPPPSSSLPLLLSAEGSSSSIKPFGNWAPSPLVHKGRRRAVEELIDKVMLQKQRRMIRNKEFTASQTFAISITNGISIIEWMNIRGRLELHFLGGKAMAINIT
ncbi:ABSCISIC ACID-INSENSITIVE 5 [Spatholobus suberectus]|nr:ABSCISIC ACID-INSENSITIVE 5 [Spatholobus suberectus]